MMILNCRNFYADALYYISTESQLKEMENKGILKVYQLTMSTFF